MENENSRGRINHTFSLHTKLQHLEQKRSLLAEELRLAALDGDLSENFDWTTANLQIEKLEKEILLLKQKITIANQTPAPRKIVTYQLLETKQNKTVQLTDFGENNPSLRPVSFTSPLGLALTGKKVGEIGKVETKKGSYWVKIINIEEK